MALIFLVEDDPVIREVTGMHLALAGYRTQELPCAADARIALQHEKPDLVLLDIMMPGEDGFSLGKYLIGQQIPVIFLTAKTAVTDRVHGLRMGADDYVLKPFEPAELLARIENVLRRNIPKETTWSSGNMRVDFVARQLWINDEIVPLAKTEFDLLEALIRQRNTAVSREALLNTVWGWKYTGETRTVDVHILRLRSKIGAERIETVYRFGYRFREDI